MKNITNTLFGASLLLAAVLGINSCRKPSVEGDFVRFSARTFSSPLTKTAYSGEVSGGKERINWVSGDQLTIACAQCGDPSVADYRVTGTITSDGAISTANALTPVSGNGLQWGTGPHNFYAVYPADVANVTKEGVASATIPASQGGTDTDESISAGVTTVSMVPDMSNAFMYASQTASPGNNVELTFYPMFTAFQFTVGGDGTGGDVTLSKVELSSTSCALSGGFSFNIGSTTYTIPSVVTTGESANNKITYTFPENTTINTNKKVCFTLFVQPRSNVVGKTDKITDLTIRFTLGDGETTRALKLKYDADHGGAFVDFPGGKKINITGLTLPTQLKSWSFTVFDVEDWDDDSPDILYGSPEVVEPGEGWIAETFAPDVSGLEGDHFYIFSPLLGPFSVSATQKVRFSPGNLQAVFAAAGDSFTWKFADNQWDYVGVNAANTSINGNGSVSAAGTVDLFGWSTSATTYGIHNSYEDSDYSGDFVDWGSDPSLVSTLGSGWRTLTRDEWVWLLGPDSSPDPGTNCRTSSTVNETPNARVAKAFLFGSVHGLIIFPDVYTHPDGVDPPTGINEILGTTSWNDNQYTVDEWAKMESAGCVFLPAAGNRSGGPDNVGSIGRYWSITPGSTTRAFAPSFYDSYVDPDITCDRALGISVRLVQDL